MIHNQTDVELTYNLKNDIEAEASLQELVDRHSGIFLDIVNNYEDYNYHAPDGELYHVRQDRRLYLTEGESGLRRMALDYVVDLNPNIKAKFTGIPTLELSVACFAIVLTSVYLP